MKQKIADREPLGGKSHVKDDFADDGEDFLGQSTEGRLAAPLLIHNKSERRTVGMPHVLEIRGGERLTPLNVLNVMKAARNYMDTDIRQYLKEYLLEVESEAGETAGEEVYDHYKQVLMNTKDKAETAVRLVEKPCMDRKVIRVTLDTTLKIIEREY